MKKNKMKLNLMMKMCYVLISLKKKIMIIQNTCVLIIIHETIIAVGNNRTRFNLFSWGIVHIFLK